MLELQDLSVAYGHRVALQGISLKVGAGEIVTLVGGNGAGKSTTLKTISGLLRARSGQITFEGQRIDALAPHQILALGLAQVPEGRLLFKDMSVWEHLELGALRAPEQGERFKETLDWVLGLFPILKERREQKAGRSEGTGSASAASVRASGDDAEASGASSAVRTSGAAVASRRAAEVADSGSGTGRSPRAHPRLVSASASAIPQTRTGRDVRVTMSASG